LLRRALIGVERWKSGDDQMNMASQERTGFSMVLDHEGIEKLLDIAPDAILLVSRDGTILTANRAAEVLFGYPPAELAGLPVEVLVPSELRQDHVRDRSRYQAHPRIRPMGTTSNIQGVHKDGTRIPLDIKLSPLEVGGQTFTTAVIRDISHLHQLQIQLEAFARELERMNLHLQRTLDEVEHQRTDLRVLNEQKNRLLGIAAHDLRNPLGAIRGFAELLEAGMMGELTERQHKMVAGIQRTSEYMHRLVNDMLDYSAIQSGEVHIDKHPVDLGRLLKEVVALELPAAERKGISIEVNVASGMPEVSADVNKVEQVMHNLLSNAIKYSEGGTVVHARLWMDGEAAAIEVVDEGQGIDPDDVPLLFEPFRRARSRATGGESSTGLGLAIVHQIVSGHGGTINVESQPGVG